MAKSPAQQSNDSISGLEDELTAALEVLDPQIRGVTDLRGHQGVSPALMDQLNSADAELVQRRTLIQTVLDDIQKLLDDLGTLEADGYPVPPSFKIDDALVMELSEEVSDTQAGAGVFHGSAPPSSVAATGTITVGEFYDPLPARNRKE